jgi:hypothetical protein
MCNELRVFPQAILEFGVVDWGVMWQGNHIVGRSVLDVDDGIRVYLSKDSQDVFLDGSRGGAFVCLGNQIGHDLSLLSASFSSAGYNLACDHIGETDQSILLGGGEGRLL